MDGESHLLYIENEREAKQLIQGMLTVGVERSWDDNELVSGFFFKPG